jgi:transposase InsO family protein
MSALKKEVPMPWLEVRPMDAKILFISDWIRGHTGFSELCEKHGISRKTGYKWVGRYQDTGIDGLQDRSRRPSRSPNKVPYTIQKEIIAAREKHKRWGSRKINKILENKYPDWDIPSHQTIHRILKEADLLSPQRRRQRVPVHPGPLEGARQPNDLWTVDFKGQFKTWDGAYCYPLTVMDQASRYLLGCDGFPGTRYKETRKAFERLFREYGLPSRIRSDNGVPFASRSIGGLSKLGVWWVRLGIMPERIESGKPQQNGHHERMHRTLKQETAKPPANNMAQQQRRFDRFRDEYNTVRPHESLDMNTPANRYKLSERPYPKRLPEMIYPGHFRETLVNHNGCIHLNGKFYYLGYLLRGELVGLNEINDGIWETYFGPLRLGEVSERLK